MVPLYFSEEPQLCNITFILAALDFNLLSFRCQVSCLNLAHRSGFLSCLDFVHVASNILLTGLNLDITSSGYLFFCVLPFTGLFLPVRYTLLQLILYLSLFLKKLFFN